MKKTIQNILYLLPLIIIWIFVARIDYEDVSRDNVVVMGDIESTETSSKDEQAENPNYTLEYKLEKKELNNGYWVETYQEYKVYKDKNGKVIEAIPTSNFNYLRYPAKE